MRTIWKHAMSVQDELEQLWTRGSKVVHVAPYEGDDGIVQFWVEHNPALSGTGRRVKLRILSTGHDIPDEWSHAGSAICGPFVWHLYISFE